MYVRTNVVQMSRPEYKDVAIPRPLGKEAEKIIRKNPKLGYTTVQDFVKDAVRRRIESISRGVNGG